MKNDNEDKLKEVASTFLINDFNQCFNQARHYDSQILDIFKYIVTFFTAISGAALLYIKFQ
jgi:hypothetical protein